MWVPSLILRRKRGIRESEVTCVDMTEAHTGVGCSRGRGSSSVRGGTAKGSRLRGPGWFSSQDRTDLGVCEAPDGHSGPGETRPCQDCRVQWEEVRP